MEFHLLVLEITYISSVNSLNSIDGYYTNLSVNAFSVPRNFTIKSISVFFVYDYLNLTFTGIATINAQLYQNIFTSGDNFFTPIGPILSLSPTLNQSSAPGIICSGISTGLSIPVAAQTRLMLIISVTDTVEKR